MILRSHYSLWKKRKIFVIIISILFILIITFLNNPSNFFANYNEENQTYNNLNDLRNPKTSSTGPNSKPLLIYQHATISETYFPLSLPTNVSFTLLEGWTSKNVTINYDGVSHQKDWVINGSFDTGEAPWEYDDDHPDYYKQDWGEIDARKCVGIRIDNGKSFIKGNYSYFEENFTIPEPSALSTLATLSMNYYFNPLGLSSSNISAFISIDIGGEEKNISAKLIDLVKLSWNGIITETYDLSTENQQILGNNDNITIRAGVIAENDTFSPNREQFIYFNNIQFTVWTKPNLPNLLIANDIDNLYNYDVYNYTNSTFGKGFTFIDESTTKSEDSDIVFTISKNDTFTEKFEVFNITITSEAVKIFNSTIDLQDGSLYTPDANITWQAECEIDILPYTYLNNWAEINKPSDWNITSVLDWKNVEKRANCTGTGLGSEKLIIPEEIFNPGLWTLEASSQSYISNGIMELWNGTFYNEESSLTFGDKFRINVTLNETITLFTNTQVNCTIEYPNGTLFLHESKPGATNVNFGNFTVGNNMSVGSYNVMLLWTNNQSYLSRDKVGYSQFNFNVWHHTILTAVDSYIERVSGEPLLIKVNFTDYDSNTYIDFATISYNSTIPGGTSEPMAYLGSGVYVADVDLSGLEAGDYYFSFNASKDHYENQSVRNLIQLKIIEQPLALEVPNTVINANSNSYATCYINITGSITGTILPGAVNISTDWHKDYTVTDYLNGIVYLNFSTEHVPTQGSLETFTVEIFANKTNYGSTSAFISVTVHPIPTVANVNETILDVYFNENFYLEVNYTEEESSKIITGATLNIIWSSTYDVVQTANGFIIDFSTEGLSLDVYTLLVQLDHPGYETAFKSIYVNIIPKSSHLEILLNQNDKTSEGSISISWNEALNITILYKDSMLNSYIAGATVQINGSSTSETIYQNISQYSIIFNSGELSVGIHFLTIRAQKENYDTVSSVLKITVEQIEFLVETIDFTDSLEVISGKSTNLRINLSEYDSGNIIENASVFYSWEFGTGFLDYVGNATYEVNLNIPDSAKGSYTITLTISMAGGAYKTSDFSFVIVASQEPTPNYIIWIIIGALLCVSGVFGALILRSYVMIPRKRKKEKLFMNTIQVFKDVRNIHGIILIQKNSGLPIFMKNVSGFDFEDNTLVSGFIQAITIFGEQVIKDKVQGDKKRKHKEIYSKHIIELNFKYFHLLICDYGPLKSILILKDKSSKKLKMQLYLFTIEIDKRFSEKIENFVGKSIDFEDEIEALLNQFLYLQYNEPYKLIRDKTYVQFLKKSRELQSTESRILNVIMSITKLNKEFTLNSVIEEIEEKNIDLVFGGLNTLIKRRIIVPTYFKDEDSHPLIGGLKKTNYFSKSDQ